MNILTYIKTKLMENKHREEMMRYYRTEYSKEWEIYRKEQPAFTDMQLSHHCFESRIDK